MAKRKSKKVAAKKKARKPSPGQQGHQLTFVLLGYLKRAQRLFLFIGELLVEVRDKEYYKELHHPDMADYAAKRLNLGQASLYRYINVYDWVKQSHPEWIGDTVKGTIPDLSDVSDLIWIEKELKRRNLSAVDRKELESLRQKGLTGELSQDELREWRTKGKKTDSLASYLSKFRSLRKRSARIAGMPPEVIKHLDAAIELLKNHQTLAKCGFDMAPAQKMWA